MKVLSGSVKCIFGCHCDKMSLSLIQLVFISMAFNFGDPGFFLWSGVKVRLLHLAQRSGELVVVILLVSKNHLRCPIDVHMFYICSFAVSETPITIYGGTPVLH